MNDRVLIGMSGGVDSSTAAWTLKRDGYDVVAVTLLFHVGEAAQAKADKAALVCEQLGIEHHVVDMRMRFVGEVVGPCARACAEGRRMDPCCNCTTHLMLPLLFSKADEYDCRHVATGHYARITHNANGVGLLPIQLRRSSDRAYDQSYLLYSLSQDQLNRLLLPLGEISKNEVRVQAMKAGLGLFELMKPYEPCFFEGRGVAQWLKDGNRIPSNPGEAVDISTGKVLGTHNGLHEYAIGQEAFEGRVVEIDRTLNKLLIGADSLAHINEAQLKDVQWTSVFPLEEMRSCRVRLSGAAKPRPCQFVPGDRPFVSFSQPVYELSSGQTLVLYSDDMVLGGGIAL